MIVEAHLANPGRLTGVLAPGCDVALEGPFPPPRVLPYTMLAARTGRVWAGTVTTYANRIFPLLLQTGVFPELLEQPTELESPMSPGRRRGAVSPASECERADSGRLRNGPEERVRATQECFSGMSSLSERRDRARLRPAPPPGDPPPDAPCDLRREVVHGRSRFDFEVDGRLVEVKSVSLADGRAGLFPDAVTARGARHCDELAALARHKRPTAIVFVAQRADIESVAAATEIDPTFARSLRGAAKAGVVVLACALRMTPRGATAVRRVPVLL